MPLYDRRKRIVERGSGGILPGPRISMGWQNVWCKNESCQYSRTGRERFRSIDHMVGEFPQLSLECPGCGAKINNWQYQASVERSDHFVFLPSHVIPRGGITMPDLGAVYGDTCTQLQVIFPHREGDDLDKIMSAYYGIYAGKNNRLCWGNGREIVNAEGMKVTERAGKSTLVQPDGSGPFVKNGVCVREITLGERTYKPGDTIPCPGSCAQYENAPDAIIHPQCAACSRHIYLRFIVIDKDHWEWARWKCYISTTSGYLHDQATDMIEHVAMSLAKLNLPGGLGSIPFTLALIPGQVTFTQNGKKMTTVQPRLNLIAPPALEAALIMATNRQLEAIAATGIVPALGAGKIIEEIEDVMETDITEGQYLDDMAYEDVTPSFTHDEYVAEIRNDPAPVTPPPSPENTPENKKRPFSAEKTVAWMNAHIKELTDNEFAFAKDADVDAIRASIERCLTEIANINGQNTPTEDHRLARQTLLAAFNLEPATYNWTAAELQAIHDWLGELEYNGKLWTNRATLKEARSIIEKGASL